MSLHPQSTPACVTATPHQKDPELGFQLPRAWFQRREKRSVTVWALGEVRVLTVDKKALLRRIQEDPTLAYRIIETMSRRVRDLDATVTRLTVDR